MRYLPKASEDLDEIYMLIAQEDPDAADRMIDRIRNALKRLADYPLSGTERNELSPGLRSVPIGKYIAFHRFEKGEIQVVRILHGARDLGTALDRLD